MDGLSRRALLAAVAAGTCGVAGCSGDGGRREPFEAPTRSAAPAEEATSTPSLTADEDRTGVPVPASARAVAAEDCPESVDPFDPPWVVSREEPLDGFLLTLRETSVPVGGTLTCELRNFADGPRTTGARSLVDVQYRGQNRWRTVFGLPEDGIDRSPVRVVHEVGDGFTWEFPFTADGLASLDGDDDGGLQVCGPVGPGIYRFVYYGVGAERDGDDEDVDLALAKAFRVRTR